MCRSESVYMTVKQSELSANWLPVYNISDQNDDAGRMQIQTLIPEFIRWVVTDIWKPLFNHFRVPCPNPSCTKCWSPKALLINILTSPSHFDKWHHEYQMMEWTVDVKQPRECSACLYSTLFPVFYLKLWYNLHLNSLIKQQHLFFSRKILFIPLSGFLEPL